jgi:hypothetical protein
MDRNTPAPPIPVVYEADELALFAKYGVGDLVGVAETEIGRVAQVGVTTSAVGAAYATWSSFPVVGLGLVVSSAMEASLR